MSFTIYPAVDIRGGKCVRLLKGDYAAESTYFDNPLEPAMKWYGEGARWLHIIDLDGAKSGQPENIEIIKAILAKIDIKIQIGGGIRSLASAKAYLDNGAARVILGSAALNNPSLVQQLLEYYGPERIVVSLDGRSGQAYSDGWLNAAGKGLVDAARELAVLGVQTFIYTDIEKDGTLTGPNINQALNIVQETGREVIIAGGIGSNEHIIELAKYDDAKIAGAIIGRALYTGHVYLPALYARLGRD
ncbi:MAG: 1-(5-phosphoribosyl)-5-[(5-phosphoribosylamino)methylideneamino]imidazole-4-carboxamide isomerase [Bacillota bacterium]